MSFANICLFVKLLKFFFFKIFCLNTWKKIFITDIYFFICYILQSKVNSVREGFS